jgi:hypothetical protein
MTKFPEIFAALAAQFDPEQVRQKQGQGGRTISYITARTAMNRLDLVLGPESWEDRLTLISDNSFLCELKITLPDGTTLTKSDVGGMAGMADAGDDDKSGASDAFKRAAVKFGVGRYLYNDGVPDFHNSQMVGALPPLRSQQSPGRAPQNPANGHAAPPHRPPARQAATVNGDGSPGDPVPVDDAPPARRPQQGDDPQNGKQLYRWVKDLERRINVGVLDYLIGWGKRTNVPGRLVEWQDDEVDRAVAEVKRKFARELGLPDDSRLDPAAPPRPGHSNDPVQNARDGLYRRMWDVATIQANGGPVTKGGLRQVLNGIRTTHPDLPEIGDLRTCEDVPLLSTYAELVENQLKRLQPATGGEDDESIPF